MLDVFEHVSPRSTLIERAVAPSNETTLHSGYLEDHISRGVNAEFDRARQLDERLGVSTSADTSFGPFPSQAHLQRYMRDRLSIEIFAPSKPVKVRPPDGASILFSAL